MAQAQVLNLEPAPRLEPAKGKNNEQMKQSKHRVEDAPIPTHVVKPRPNGTFGRDRLIPTPHYPEYALSLIARGHFELSRFSLRNGILKEGDFMRTSH